MALFGSSDPEPAEVGGRPLTCQVCGHTRFRRRRAKLNTTWMTFFELDWLNRSADCYVCDRCGFVHWFLTR
ncbi:MAG TPA: hypothetical protein VNI61_11310 [Gemmatimonadales bacterium]|nr:hypothetical protein [Gemmatimonadales bacterium]